MKESTKHLLEIKESITKLNLTKARVSIFTSLFVISSGALLATPVIDKGADPSIGNDYKEIELSKVEPSILAVSGSYTFDYFENISGGFQNGGAGMGLLDIGLEVDLERLFGWKDTTFVVSSFAGHGRDFSAEVVGDLGVVSNLSLIHI